MNKNKGRLLACALAVAVTNVTMLEIPVAHAQDNGTAYNNVIVDNNPKEPASQLAATDKLKKEDEDIDVKTDQESIVKKDLPAEENKAVSSNKKMIEKENPIEKWKKQRPEEKKVVDSAAQYNGMTVVSVDVAGLTTLTKSTVMDAVKIKPGDIFASKNITIDRQAIYETGLFYDNFPSYEVVPEGVKITYHVMENPVLRKINITGNRDISTDKIKSMLHVKVGQILNSKTLSNDIANIEEEYRSEGYILAKVSNMAIDENGVLNLKFDEGILEGYVVKGNDKTKTKVITREMRMKPGDAFNAKLAKRSMQRIYNLGFFQDVNMKLLPGEKDPNSVIIETTVVEKRTGSFGIGAGYSNSDGFIGMITLSDSNFRGTGDATKLVYEFGGDDNNDRGFTFSYRHPWLDSKETSLSLSIYNRTYEYDDYDSDGNEIEDYDRSYKGGEITLGRPVNEYSTNYITLRNRKDEYAGHEDGLDRSNNTEWKDSNFGTTRSITFMHVLDTRDNVYNPMEGSRYSVSVEAAGLGGDFNYDKYILNTQRFYNLGHSHVLALKLNGGYANHDLPEAGRFEIGGQGTLRGYKDDQFKGNKMILGSIEYRFPIITKVQGALFFDMGDAWGGRNWSWQPIEDKLSLHHSYGVGIQIETPVGPLRLDYGIGEDGGRTNFSIGGSF
ncbi:BamA/OMP85 family outer membrane protein [Pectinatus sottacetonis]|uniref:BamA/OMP85 family outer membrane protein n=1 Tax=Pectinatus sottacetonis TaxID=1002795 RepID=UPI0018C561D6|nr:BamA/TamA family outer membrane protein [Pectinatus sottacetonis]